MSPDIVMTVTVDSENIPHFLSSHLHVPGTEHCGSQTPENVIPHYTGEETEAQRREGTRPQARLESNKDKDWASECETFLGKARSVRGAGRRHVSLWPVDREEVLQTLCPSTEGRYSGHSPGLCAYSNM